MTPEALVQFRAATAGLVGLGLAFADDQRAAERLEFWRQQFRRAADEYAEACKAIEA